MMQLEGYDEINYIKWLHNSITAYSQRLKRAMGLVILTTILYLVAYGLIEINNDILLISYDLLWVFYMILTFERKEEQSKKPLVFTNRAKRLFTTNLILDIAIVLITLIIYANILGDNPYYFPVILFICAMLYYFQSYAMYLSNIIIKPLERRINEYYYEKARNKIQSIEDLQVVGITGSFGKTSTKFITATILKQKYRVLNTPESYNTPMGLSKVINEMLEDKYQVFIAEMGAKKIGEIRELAKLTSPNIGVITSIGPVHLETFHNIDNIMKTKYELIEELPAEGIAIFNYDNQYVRKLADKTFKEKILYGMNDVEKLDLYAENIETTENGSIFTLKDKSGKGVQCRTKLLGKHNIYNILAGASVGIALGLDLEEIRKGIEKIEPIPHRLNIINPGTGIIIIDDAFNSNPDGAKAALEVLQEFKGDRKIIVTPGMIELGEKEKEANREFGINIAKVCDYVILVGKKITLPIYEGLIGEGYNKDNIFIVNNLDEATEIIQKIARPRDVILFENDLPDNYYK